MENELKTYKTATWILVIIVLVLAFMLVRASDRDAETGIEAATAQLEKCSDDLAAWTAANPDPKVATAEAQNELSDILKSCSADTSEIEEDGTLKQ